MTNYFAFITYINLSLDKKLCQFHLKNKSHYFLTKENVATETLATAAANASRSTSSGLGFGWGNKGGNRSNEQVVDFSMPQQELKLLDIVRAIIFFYFKYFSLQQLTILSG